MGGACCVGERGVVAGGRGARACGTAPLQQLALLLHQWVCESWCVTWCAGGRLCCLWGVHLPHGLGGGAAARSMSRTARIAAALTSAELHICSSAAAACSIRVHCTPVIAAATLHLTAAIPERPSRASRQRTPRLLLLNCLEPEGAAGLPNACAITSSPQLQRSSAAAASSSSPGRRASSISQCTGAGSHF